jgi:hypothetical protein
MGFWDNVAKGVFEAATGLDPDSAKDREEIRRRMDAARDLEEVRRQQQAAERARGTAGGLLDWLKNK